MKKSHRKTAIALCTAGALSVSTAFAADSTPQLGKQQIGMGTGAVLGALVGGPPGLFIGAFAGSMIGRDQDSQSQLAERDQDLQDSRSEIARLQQSIELQNTATAAGPQQSGPQQNKQQQFASAAIAKGFCYTVQFRSDSSELEPHYQRQLLTLARTLAVFGDLHIHLNGYTDPRGTDQHNLGLSQRRIDAVRTYLLQSGVSANRIDYTAHGEQEAMAGDSDTEAMFFDRRVQVRFSLTDAPA